MYRRNFVSLCLLCLLFICAGGEAAVPEVVGVDFYPSGARFVFQLRPDKEGDFEFTLPGPFAPETVRPLIRGSASMRAEAVQMRPEPFPELAPLEKIVAEKRREARLREARVNAVNQALAMLQRTISHDVGEGELTDYIHSAVDAASDKRLQYELELVDLVIEMEKANKDLQEAEEKLTIARAELERKSPDRSRVVRVEGSASGTEPVLFEAYTGDARWNTRYDINLNGETGLVNAVMFASVRQRTGFDVEGEFNFHTRNPSFSIDPPDLPPLVVRLAERMRPMPTAARGQSSMMMDDMAAPMMEAVMAPPPEPEVFSTLASVSVKGEGRLKGDGTLSDVLLGQFEFLSTPLLISIPERNREAWVVASLDSVPEALLPGAAELYVDGVASGRTNIPAIGLQGTLPFGMAQRVTAEKKRAVGRAGTTWLGRGTLQDGYTIEVTNNMDAGREIEVRDRLPLPADDRIRIEDIKLDPAPALRDDENRLTWKLLLKPGETGKISVEYTLRYPGDETLAYW
ncbi:MAG: DUF4139 domain-containing protein [Synergistaceae bacterium]|nr:DUF4139 domain-containing protein [Synergistaceae bacterium]